MAFKRQVLKLPHERGKSDIGHTGTLDPFAEGILLLAWQEGTKLLSCLNGLPKSYLVQMRFGATTETLDSESEVKEAGEEHKQALTDLFTKQSPEDFLKSKVGIFEQVPPQFSAVHVDGVRAYDLARRGIKSELKARRAEILSARHVGFDRETRLWDFEVSVSSGTYIRSLARDWGIELSGTPGYLTALLRSKVGAFSFEPLEGEDSGVKRAEIELPFLKEQKVPLYWKNMNIQDLSPYFETQTLSQEAASLLQLHGRLSFCPKSSAKPLLLLNDKGSSIAFLEAQTSKIGRVFRFDPFA
jgi:tRNA pseudouridine(55) synthase